MLKKWEIVPAPNEKNPARHKLLIKGEMKDIFLIVKKLGGICSRPEKTSGGYDFLIYLSKVEGDVQAKLKSVSEELGSIAVEDKSADTPAARPQVEAGYFSAQPAAVNAAPPATPAPAAPPPAAPAPETPPALSPEPAAPSLQLEPKPSFAAPQAAPAPAPLPPAAAQPAPARPQPAAPAPLLPPSVPAPLAPPQGNMVPSISNRMRREDMTEQPAAAPVPAPEPEKTAAPVAKIKAKWPMELPLIPTYNFQTLVAGAHNRFAHAAAMAVVENPGVIYNPLLLCGGPGTGKTHFVNAVAGGLAKAVGQAGVFVTDGVKFSKGVELAAKEGGVERLNSLFSGIKALIIDDVHLLMISESNRAFISKWLNDFVSKNRQIVVTSLFPPKALAGLEESAGFQFTQGWMVDLKAPAAQSYKLILNQLLQGMEVKLSETDIGNFFSGRQIPLGEVVAVCEALKKLEKFVVNSSNGLTHSQLLEMLFGITEPPPAPPTPQELQQGETWKASDRDEWFRWGMFYPKGHEQQARYALCTLSARAAELGINTQWKQVFMEAYDPDETYGTPFRVGNAAGERGVNGMIVLGPPQHSAIGAQENDFRTLTVKVLDSFSIRSGWLPLARLKSPSAYARMLMDLL